MAGGLRRFVPPLAAFILAAALILGVAGVQTRPAPSDDSVSYLAYGRSLLLAGTYARTPAGPAADAVPGREPLYPAVIALAARMLPGLAEAVARCDDSGAPACGPGLGPLYLLNGLFLAASVVLAGLSARRLGGGRVAVAVAAGYLALNFQMFKELKYLISDPLATFCAALAGWLFCRAWSRPDHGASWAAAGLALAALALVKGLFLPFAVLMVLVAAFRARMLCTLALVLALAVPVGGWTARNLSWFGAVSDGRGAIALSTREIFTHMTPPEHLAAFLWWTRGPGAGLAKRWLPESAWHRHEWYEADGFFNQGQVVRPRERAQANQSVVTEMLAEWPSWLVTMPVLFYRGLWFDEFILFGLPALIWLVWRSVRRREGAALAALAPGLWSLLAYPAISLNIPRYQFPAAFALAVAAGLAAEALAQRWRKRRV